MGFNGSRFTWMRGNSKNSHRSAHLDRALSNISWRHKFAYASIFHLPHLHSNHNLMLVSIEGAKILNVDRPFHVQAAWFSHEDFDSIIKNNWKTNVPFSDNSRHMTDTLKNWNANVFGNIFKRKRRLLARITGVQRKIAISPNLGLFRLDKKLKEELDLVLKQEEIFFFQKSREDWIVNGDRNTSFFPSFYSYSEK